TMGFERLSGGPAPKAFAGLPDLDLAFLGGTPRADCKVLAVARESHGAHRFRDARHLSQELPAGRRGEAAFSIAAGSPDRSIRREGNCTDLLCHRRRLELWDLGFMKGLQLTDVLI